MNETWSIEGLGGVLDTVGDAACVAALLAQVTRDDLARMEALAAAGGRDELVRVAHHMVGAFGLFAQVPAFAQIRDVIDALHCRDADRLIAQLPSHRDRLLEFVARLEQVAQAASR